MFDFLKKLRKPPPETPAAEPATEVSGLARLEDATTMSDMLPNVRHLAVNLFVRGPDREIEPSMNNRSFGPRSRAFFHFRCKNVDCVDGGFDLQDEISATVRDGRNAVSGRRVCRGWRSAATVGQQRCFFELNFKIHVAYTDDA